MLVSLRSLLGYRVAAYDGAVGRFTDFYFDDRSWRLRHGIVDTGTFFSPHEVLVAASVLGQPDGVRRLAPIRLTQDELARCPSPDTAKPVCRQEEAKLPYYYFLPPSWEPSLALPTVSTVFATRDAPAPDEVSGSEGCDPHLRSFREVSGYRVKASDGDVGVVQVNEVNGGKRGKRGQLRMALT